MNNHNGNSSNGFVLGLLIGGAIVFLVGTDKGRKILKAITEEGFSELSEIIERAEEKIEEEMEEEEASPIKEKERVEEKVSTSNGHSASVSSASAKKRFFRRPVKS